MNRFNRSAVALYKPSQHSFQDGVIHVVIEEQWKSASQGRDSPRAYSAILLLKNVTENLKYVIFCLKKSKKREHFYVTHEHQQN